MLKQSSSRIKRVLAILLIVLFVVSVTVATVSAAKQVKKGHTAVVKTGGHHRPRAHYYHGHYYPNCDWVWSPHQQQWIWGC